MNADKLPVWQMSVDEVKALIETNRQQADRIAELEKEADRLSSHADELRKIHSDRIAELEKDLEGCEYFLNQEKQSEPVAELLVNDGEPWGCRYDDNITLAGVDGWIPLYTTPHHASDVKQTKPLNQQTLECPSYLHNFAPQTKPLSNEEMVSEWDLISYDPKTYTWTDKCSNDLIIRFGRAIEAKVRGQ